VWKTPRAAGRWVSALPSTYEAEQKTLVAKGYRLTQLGTWQAGGLDFNLGDFLKSLFDGTTVSTDDPNDGDDDDDDD
jgi:hypothetical protein